MQDVFRGLDGRADSSGVEWGDGSETGVEEKLRGLSVGGFVSSLLRRGRKRRVYVADEDALTEIAAHGFTKCCGLGVGFRSDAADVEACDAAIEPEASYVGKISGRDVGVEVEHDADVVAAGFVNEVVEIVEGTVGGVDGLSVGCVGLDGGEKEGVGTEGLDIVEALGDAVETAAASGAEVDGIYLIDDGVFPPNVGVDAGADPAGACKGLRKGRRDEDAGEKKREVSARNRYGHALVNEMLREFAGGWISLFYRAMVCHAPRMVPQGSGLYFCHRERRMDRVNLCLLLLRISRCTSS